MINTDKNGIKTVTGERVRLVYMGKQHITTIEGTVKSMTWTKQDVEEFTTKKQADDRKKDLDLEEIINKEHFKIAKDGA